MEDGKGRQARRLATIAVPVPSLGALTYCVPNHLALPVPGARALVPLGTLPTGSSFRPGPP
jgi:primosomal protein N'